MVDQWYPVGMRKGCLLACKVFYFASLEPMLILVSRRTRDFKIIQVDCYWPFDWLKLTNYYVSFGLASFPVENQKKRNS